MKNTLSEKQEKISAKKLILLITLSAAVYNIIHSFDETSQKLAYTESKRKTAVQQQIILFYSIYRKH